MTIAVTTPTGNVGRHLVPTLIRAGVRPRLLLRHPEQLDPELRRAVDVAVVDLLDPASVVAATAGVESLYWVDPPPEGEDPLADYRRATASVVRAVEANGLARVVLQSSVGAEKRHGVGEIDGLAHTEVALDATGVSVGHLRCGYFFSNLLLQLDEVRGGVLSVVLPTDSALPWVAPRDVAEVAATRLLSAAWHGRVVQAVHGPRDLTWAEAVEIVATATGRPLRVQRLSDQTMRAGLRDAGMPDAVVEAILGMSTGLRDDFTPEQPRSLASTTPTTLGAWAYEVLRPLLAAP